MQTAMETRKVQRLGPSTLAMTLPAEWTHEHDVEKGQEVSLRMGGERDTHRAAGVGDGRRTRRQRCGRIT